MPGTALAAVHDVWRWLTGSGAEKAGVHTGGSPAPHLNPYLSSPDHPPKVGPSTYINCEIKDKTSLGTWHALCGTELAPGGYQEKGDWGVVIWPLM
eukprot:588222-Rhodomonas_salina.1